MGKHKKKRIDWQMHGRHLIHWLSVFGKEAVRVVVDIAENVCLGIKVTVVGLAKHGYLAIRFAVVTLWRILRRRPARTLLILLMCLWLFSLTKDYFPTYLHLLVWGFLAAMAGPAINVLCEDWPRKGKWFRVSLYPLGIALGALLSTQGWKEYDNLKREEAILAAVATEWRLNDIDLRSLPALRDAIEKSGYGYSGETFPRFSISQTTNALGQSCTVVEDSNLAKLMLCYQIYANDLNCSIEDFRNLIGPLKAAVGWRRVSITKMFNPKMAYECFRDSHVELGEYLEKRYPHPYKKSYERLGSRIWHRIYFNVDPNTQEAKDPNTPLPQITK